MFDYGIRKYQIELTITEGHIRGIAHYPVTATFGIYPFRSKIEDRDARREWQSKLPCHLPKIAVAPDIEYRTGSIDANLFVAQNYPLSAKITNTRPLGIQEV